MKKGSFLVKVWDILWPLLVYPGVQILCSMCFGENMAAFGLLLAALICIPIYLWICQKDFKAAGEQKRNLTFTTKDMPAVIVSGAALALAANNLIMLTPLPYLFSGYQKTNEVLAGSGQLLEIFTAGIFCCIVEEILMRGVVYRRMKQWMEKKQAMVLSSLVFGLYHLNAVQAVYAFILGLFFVWIYERYDSLWASCIAHMSANLFVIFLSGTSIYTKAEGSLVGFCLVTCISILVFYYGCRLIKQTNPSAELEFIEKEPDTLQKLTEEYKEQEKKEE